MSTDALAKGISWVFQPMIMPLLSFAFVLYIDPRYTVEIQPVVKQAVLQLVGLNTLLAPALIVFYLYRLRVIRSLNSPDRRDRILMLSISGTLVAITYLLLNQYQLPGIIFDILLLMLAMNIAALIVTVRVKLSIHGMASVGAMVVLIYCFRKGNYFLPGWMAVAVLATGLVAWSRLHLKIHTAREMVWGVITAFATGIITLSFLS